MQLDRTRFAIRPRNVWDLLDLSLRVTRIYAKPLAVITALAAAPFALGNFWALHWIIADEQTPTSRQQYLACMALFVFLQAPIVTLPATQLMGRAMFQQSIDPKRIWGDLRQVTGRLIWVQGVWRHGFLVMLVALLIGSSRNADGGTGLLILLAMYAFILRAARPYINEIILLERAPIRATKGSPISISRRSRVLHGSSVGDLFVRWAVAAMANGLLCLNLILVGWFTSGILSGDWRWSAWMVEFVCPVCMWLVSLYATVFKFLSYLDTRIRYEGWEVELTVMAAEQELRGAV